MAESWTMQWICWCIPISKSLTLFLKAAFRASTTSTTFSRRNTACPRCSIKRTRAAMLYSRFSPFFAFCNCFSPTRAPDRPVFCSRFLPFSTFWYWLSMAQAPLRYTTPVLPSFTTTYLIFRTQKMQPPKLIIYKLVYPQDRTLRKRRKPLYYKGTEKVWF